MGSWTSVFLLRRRALSLLQICFEALTSTEDDDVIRLSPGLRDEMWSWVLLGPVCVADLRAQVLEAAFATDASDDMIAAVRADVPAEVATEVFQHSLQKGAWTRLLSGPQAWFREKGLLCESQELPGEEAFTPHPLWRVLARSLNYRKVFTSRVRATTHINLKELHAFLRLEERIGDRMVNVRFVCALDSQVSLGALTKGRAASPALNKCLRGSLAYHLGCNLSCGLGYVRSNENPADDPTREVELRSACDSLPEWWIPLARGDSAAFQLWLEQREELAPDPTKFHPGALKEKFEAIGRFASSPAPSPAERLRPQPKHGLRQKFSKLAARLGCPDDRLLRNLPGFEVHQGKALEAFPRSWFWPPSGRLDFDKRGALHLEARHSGVARRLVRGGLPWVLSVPRATDEPESADGLRQACEAAIGAGCFDVCIASPAVGSLSIACTPPSQVPRSGRPGQRQGLVDCLLLGRV